MKAALIPKDAFASGLLNMDYHDKLIADLERIVKKAGVPMSAIWTPLSSVCEKDGDYAWVRDLKISEDGGLVYVGKGVKASIEEKMKAIVGACLRNYTDARMMTVEDVLKRLKDDDLPNPTVLLIPNFCYDKINGGDVPSWDVHHLLDLLIARATSGKKTVIYIPSWGTLKKSYGDAFVDHLYAYYAMCHGETYTKAKVLENVTA